MGDQLATNKPVFVAGIEGCYSSITETLSNGICTSEMKNRKRVRSHELPTLHDMMKTN